MQNKIQKCKRNNKNMELEGEEVLAPMSPSAQYLKSSALSLTILGVLESEVPIDESMAIPLLKDLFLPINPRFSSIMVTKDNGVRKWKKVEVKLQDHVHIPTFDSEMSIEYYEELLSDYLSNLGMEQLPPNRPLWEVHIFKYPTKNAAGNIIFKLHHSLGDGYSLMGALLSCSHRVDNPLLPLTFPSRRANIQPSGFLNRIPRFFTGIAYTAYDFGLSVLKSTFMQDDKSPVRSGEIGVEFKPLVTTTTTFSIDQIRQITSRLNVTINDVITGMIMFGTRLYMQKASEESKIADCTALVLLNTRAIGGYRSIHEMIKPDTNMPWGNRFAFLPVQIPKLTAHELQNPLIFVTKAHQIIKRQRNSASVYLTGQFLNFIGKIRTTEAVGQHIHSTLKNTSMAMSNLIGPVEQMGLPNHPIKGLYFTATGLPQSLIVTIISYMGKLRITITVEKGFIDENKIKSCIEYAFEVISKAALDSPQTKTKAN